MPPLPQREPQRDPYLTAEDLAARWGVDVSTVYRWGRTGRIARAVIGERTVRFPRTVLDAPAGAGQE